MKEYIVNPEEERLFYGDKYDVLTRCKDCKHRTHNGTCIKNMKRKPDDGFCDEGERNEW